MDAPRHRIWQAIFAGLFVFWAVVSFIIVQVVS